ncbi:AIPR family protein [Sphingomonas sp. RT2P30]|uniref:AIPR family protein n=1 Tax=Parasphingomonas halimpatiens TaxID=3096162 RepID=UPI002FCC56C9
MKPEDLDYKSILSLASKHIAKGRSESAAFLNWFLEEVYNLDDIEADDSICDGNYDQGIDAIYVNDLDQEVVFFQSKLSQNFAKTLGDVALKEFSGSLGQFDSAEKVAALAANTKNSELKKLVERSKIPEKIGTGYKIRGVFITNALRDENAVAFLGNHLSITLYDRQRIAEEYIDINAPEGVQGKTSLSVFESLMLIYEAGSQATMYQFITPASDLVSLSGISDFSLFAQNVRLPLGNTSVNRGIRESLGHKETHPLFPLFHNGITLLCDLVDISSDGETLIVTNYVVVNGAQTVSTLYKDRDKISPDLRARAESG